jgi:hypothetical protein
MRTLLALAVVSVVLGIGVHPAAANELEGPWCAMAWLGGGGVSRDCHFRTFDECWPNVISGNRGSCNPNPRWAGWNAPVEPGWRHAKRHAKRS